MKRYKVTLEDDERQQLHDLIAAGQAAARKLSHARILLKADASDGGPVWPDHRIADALELSTATVERGLDAALDRKQSLLVVDAAGGRLGERVDLGEVP